MKVDENFLNLFKEGLKISKNISKTVIKATTNTIQAKTIITEKDLSSKRLEICEKCPSLIKSSRRCAECGCFVSAKTQFQFEECPLEKW